MGEKSDERHKIGKVWGPGIFGEDGDDVIMEGPGNDNYYDEGLEMILITAVKQLTDKY